MLLANKNLEGAGTRNLKRRTDKLYKEKFCYKTEEHK